MSLNIRVPFDDAIMSRDTTTDKDALTTNVFFDTVAEGQTLVKRPGLQNLTSALGLGVQGALGLGLGIFFYEDKLYSFNSPELGTTLKGFITNGNILLTSAYRNQSSDGDRVIFIETNDEIKVKPLPVDIINDTWTATVYTGTRFLVVGNNTNDAPDSVPVLYSTDGIAWTKVLAPYLGGTEFITGAVAGTTIVMVDAGINYTIVSTNNGTTWTGHNPNLNNPDSQGIIGSNGTTFTSGGHYSTDGITWTPCTGTPHIASYPIVWNGSFFLQAENGIIYKSINGIAWTTPITTGLVPTIFQWSSTLDRFAGFAESGGTTYPVYSSDGVNWTTAVFSGLPIPQNITVFNGAYYGLSQVLPVVSGAPFLLTFVLKSVDGINWIAYAIDVALFEETPTLIAGLV